MLKRICLAFALFVLGTSPLLAQSSVLPYFYTTGNTKVAVGNNNPLPVTISGGGGGGLSVQDQAPFTAGNSNFTPGGGVYNDSATLTSGQQGTFRMNAKRAVKVDVDTTGNSLYDAITSPIPACASSPCTTVIGATVLYQGTSALSATNGIYSNLLQGNAVLSATNPTFTRLTDGTNTQVTDPCQAVTKINLTGTQTTGTQIIAGTSAKKTYICSFSIRAAAAEVWNVIAGTGSVCATGSSAVAGSTTAANGFSEAANGGQTLGNGLGTVMAATAANADNICITQNGSSRLTYQLTYVQL